MRQICGSDDSLMLEGRDVQDLSSSTSILAPDESSNNVRKRRNKKRPRITKSARKLGVTTTLTFSQPDPES